MEKDTQKDDTQTGEYLQFFPDFDGNQDSRNFRNQLSEDTDTQDFDPLKKAHWKNKEYYRLP